MQGSQGSSAAKAVASWLLGIAVWSGVLFGQAAPAAEARTLLQPRAEAELRDAIAAVRTRIGIPGLSVAIWSEGRIALELGMGLAEVEHAVPATPETLYRSASLSKPMTAVAILREARAGRMDLDTDVAQLVPEWPQKASPVTIRQLLGHLGGVRGYRRGETLSNTAYSSLAKGLGIFADDPLVHAPGSEYLYSTYGFNLAGRALERATEEEFYAALHRLVLKPAGLRSTVVDEVTRIIPGRCGLYRRDSRGAIRRATPIDPSYKVPGGGLLTTVGDLARFAIALEGKALLDPELKAQAWKRGQLSSGKATSYGLGFVLAGQPGQGFEVLHTGGQQGTTALFLMQPERRRGIAILTNLERIPQITTLGRRWLRIALGG